MDPKNADALDRPLAEQLTEGSSSQEPIATGTSSLSPHSRSQPSSAIAKLERRARRARIVLGVAVLVLVLSVISTIAEIQLLYDLKAAETSLLNVVPQTRIDSNDTRQLFVGLSWLVVFVVGTITFLMWLHCATTNLKSAGWTRFSPAWSVGWWFVPIANLFKPYQVLKEAWVQSSSADPALPPESTPVWSWLGWYWAAFLIGGWLGQIVFRMALGAETHDDFLVAAFLSIASDALWVVAGVLLFAYIGDVTRRQNANRSVL